jgi:mono/diheme cytochrome c family protein
VYSEAQAKRGAAFYAGRCIRCHGEDLTGVDDATPLVGPTFLSKWNGQTMADLLEQTQKSMPKDQPGTLTRQQSVDVLAYVLKANAYPASETELPREIDALKQIRIEQVKK